RGGEPAGLDLAPTMTIRHPHTGGHRVLVHVPAGATRGQRLHPRLLQTHQHQGVTRRSLYQGNLSLVLVATVRGARGSHVRLISGLAAPRERRRRPDDQHIFIRRGWPSTAMGGLSAITDLVTAYWEHGPDPGHRVHPGSAGRAGGADRRRRLDRARAH